MIKLIFKPYKKNNKKMTNDYYHKHKEKFWKEAHKRYQSLSEEDKEKKT